MKKLITILGIVLTVTILLSGSAVAAWHYCEVFDYEDCTDINYIRGIDDTNHATIGQDGSPGILGWVLLDLSATYAMGPKQEFWVNASSYISEDYDVYVQETDHSTPVFVGSGEDTANHYFTTPTTIEKEWRFILIVGDSGIDPIYPNPPDYAYGPDIDCVGWED